MSRRASFKHPLPFASLCMCAFWNAFPPTPYRLPPFPLRVLEAQLHSRLALNHHPVNVKRHHFKRRSQLRRKVEEPPPLLLLLKKSFEMVILSEKHTEERDNHTHTYTQCPASSLLSLYSTACVLQSVDVQFSDQSPRRVLSLPSFVVRSFSPLSECWLLSTI